MAGELSQHELEELVVGKAQKPTVVFYDKARLNVSESKKAGRRIYSTFTYINERQVGVTDWVAEKAQPHHIKNYPREYKLYLEGQKETSPSVGIIPNISPAELQELIDMRLGTIERLAEVTIVPVHLNKVWEMAKTLQSVLMEQQDGNEEIKHEESIQTENVLAERGRIDSDDVGQCIVPPSLGREEREVAEGLPTGGRLNGHQPKVSDNWSISFE